MTTATSVPVANANSHPVPMLDAGAFTPYEQALALGIPDGSNAVSAYITAPLSTRLVIELISFFRKGSFQNSDVAVLISTSAGTVALPTAAATTGKYSTANLSGTFYIEPAAQAYVDVERTTNNTAVDETDDVYISGHLVNVP